MKYVLNKTKAILSATVTLFFLSLTILYTIQRKPLETITLLFLTILFSIVFFINVSFLEIDHSSIRLKFLRFNRKTLFWTDIHEVGLIGDNLFKTIKKGSGEKYIYFSPKPLSERERFQMALKWPTSRDILYMAYTEKRLNYIMYIWGKELKTYNVLDLYPDTKD